MNEFRNLIDLVKQAKYIELDQLQSVLGGSTDPDDYNDNALDEITRWLIKLRNNSHLVSEQVAREVEYAISFIEDLDLDYEDEE